MLCKYLVHTILVILFLDTHIVVHVSLLVDTAITRARVNVFIAETNLELSRPMFSYFQRRAVVDMVSKDRAGGLSGVRVFGVGMNRWELLCVVVWLKHWLVSHFHFLILLLSTTQLGGLEEARGILSPKC